MKVVDKEQKGTDKCVNNPMQAETGSFAAVHTLKSFCAPVQEKKRREDERILSPSQIPFK